VSPVERAATGALTVSDSLSRQAGGGVVRKGGVDSRLDVVTLAKDNAPPASAKGPKQQETKRSKSTSAVVRHKQTCLKFDNLVN
jgi:cell division cycle 20, cofactor of APC complex